MSLRNEHLFLDSCGPYPQFLAAHGSAYKSRHKYLSCGQSLDGASVS